MTVIAYTHYWPEALTCSYMPATITRSHNSVHGSRLSYDQLRTCKGKVGKHVRLETTSERVSGQVTRKKDPRRAQMPSSHPIHAHLVGAAGMQSAKIQQDLITTTSRVRSRRKGSASPRRACNKPKKNKHDGFTAKTLKAFSTQETR